MLWKLLLLCAVALPPGAVAFADALPITNADFSAVPIVCGLGYAYQTFGEDCSSVVVPQQDFNGTPGFGWTFLSLGGNGLTGPSTNFNPPSFSGLPFTQAAFLQGNNSAVWQTIGDFSAGGTYTLRFYLGSRYFDCSGPPCVEPFDGNQTVEALIGGEVIGTWALTTFTPFTLEDAVFTVSTGGSQVLEFRGLSPGDHTAFLSEVKIDTVPEPSSVVLLAIVAASVVLLSRRRLQRLPAVQKTV